MMLRLRKYSIAAGLGLASISTFGAAPDAGQILNSLTPPAAPIIPNKTPLISEPVRPPMVEQEGQRILVKGFRFSGNTTYSETELMSLVAEGIGKELTLTEINALVRKVTLYYRSHGLVLARAYVPAQEVKNGVIEIMVLEGRLGKVNIDNGSQIATDIVNQQLVALKEDDGLLRDRSLGRSILLLRDLPGIEVSATLKPGTAVGTSDLDIGLRDASALAGSVSLDNWGNSSTGAVRGNLDMSYANLFGRGDSLSFRGIDSSGMTFGRIGWQTPLGTDGWKAGAALSDMNYHLGKGFAALGAHGLGWVSSLFASYPLVRSTEQNLNLLMNYDNKRLRDVVDASGLLTDKQIGVMSVTLLGDHPDYLLGGGYSTGMLGLGVGHLLLDPTNAAADQSATGHRTGGNYSKLTYGFTRIQQLDEIWSLYGSFSGQIAQKNLDSSEKFILGGASAVRAYPQGEAAGDDAWLATVELRYNISQNVQALAFYDAAQARLNHSPIAGETNNQPYLAGGGLGLQYNKVGEFGLKAYVSWRSTGPATSDADRLPRAWVQLTKGF
jgi:hemolysin activation/secretion protein